MLIFHLIDVQKKRQDFILPIMLINIIKYINIYEMSNIRCVCPFCYFYVNYNFDKICKQIYEYIWNVKMLYVLIPNIYKCTLVLFFFLINLNEASKCKYSVQGCAKPFKAYTWITKWMVANWYIFTNISNVIFIECMKI